MPLSEIVLVITGLLTIAMVAAGICRNIPIPYTVFLVILGVILGSVARNWSEFEPLLAFQLTPDLVLFLFLPALIFESAFNLDARQLLKDIAPVMVLAIPALLMSTAIIGIGLWSVLDISLLLALLFGALISATDPVAVIALFKELGAPQRLTILVEGESLLNDATAIVIFKIILGLILGGALTASEVGGAFLDFFIVFFGGILVGGAIGVVLSEILYRLHVGLSSYLVMSIVLAYSCFTIAEHILDVSGVMAVVASGISLAIFGMSRIPQAATHLIKETWEVIVLVCNSLLFLLVGLSINLVQLLSHIDVILLAVFFMLLARAAAVYSMVPATVRLFKLPYVTLGERHVMWWGGLKGGLAIAIVLSIPEDLAGRELLLDMTLGAIMFTLLFNAPTVKPLIQKLGIDRLTDDERSELKHGLIQAQRHTSSILQRLHDVELISRSTQQLIQKKSEHVFASDAPEIDRKQDVRYLYITALRVEEEELKHLYETGFIQNYIYLDIKTTLQRDKESRLTKPEQQQSRYKQNKSSIFLRIERALIRRLREHDWAAGLLARYQYLRFSQSLQRDIAGILTAMAVLDMLEKQTEHDKTQRDQVAEAYQERIKRRRERLRRVAIEFPEFYLRFETRMFAKVAMLTASHYAEEAFQHGEIGSKAFARIERRIKETLASLPPISNPAPKLKPSDLIGAVPFLNGLSTEVLEGLSKRAKAVTFLANDIIIGEGERGDALYIITHGRVSVIKEDKVVAELRDGEFFGEMALLGDQIRSATVKAMVPSTLLRLTRRDVMSLAETDPELKLRLEDANEMRRKNPD
ncbi:MAG: cation:proton antiporter [Gammaproteobacteria bacterium]